MYVKQIKILKLMLLIYIITILINCKPALSSEKKVQTIEKTIQINVSKIPPIEIPIKEVKPLEIDIQKIKPIEIKVNNPTPVKLKFEEIYPENFSKNNSKSEWYKKTDWPMVVVTALGIIVAIIFYKKQNETIKKQNETIKNQQDIDIFQSAINIHKDNMRQNKINTILCDEYMCKIINSYILGDYKVKETDTSQLKKEKENYISMILLLLKNGEFSNFLSSHKATISYPAEITDKKTKKKLYRQYISLIPQNQILFMILILSALKEVNTEYIEFFELLRNAEILNIETVNKKDIANIIVILYCYNNNIYPGKPFPFLDGGNGSKDQIIKIFKNTFKLIPKNEVELMLNNNKESIVNEIKRMGENYPELDPNATPEEIFKKAITFAYSKND